MNNMNWICNTKLDDMISYAMIFGLLFEVSNSSIIFNIDKHKKSNT